MPAHNHCLTYTENAMKIVIAPDSFKESLSAIDAAHAIQRGFASHFPDADYYLVPMADGGEGTVAALLAARGGQWQSVSVEDPLGRPITARYGLLPDGSAVMEMAEASGLHLLSAEERNPLITSTYGTGQMIADAISKGARHIILGIGGSATNDAGAGMAQALGFRLLDANGNELPRGGQALAQLAHVDAPPPLPVTLTVACDVNNPLCGERGASAIFGPQKGATPAIVAELDSALAHFAAILLKQGYADERDSAGSGAAGGLGYGLRTLLGAELRPGIDIVIEAAQLADLLHHASLVLTGEGKMDGQTAFGKVPLGVLNAAKVHNIPVIGLAGSVGADIDKLNELGFTAIFPSIARPAPLANILADAEENLERTARQVAAVWKLGQRKNSKPWIL